MNLASPAGPLNFLDSDISNQDISKLAANYTLWTAFTPNFTTMQRTEFPRAHERSDWSTIRALLPYLWQFKGRVVLAMTCLIIAKVANVWVPLVLKDIVDNLDASKVQLLVLPVSLLLAYGALRLGYALFSELRDIIFAKVTQRAIRSVALHVFHHLHSLSLRFHLERQTGGVSRDIERGTRGISFLLNFMLFNILPTLAELGMVTIILLLNYDVWFAVVTLATIFSYVIYTLAVTEWRMRYRREMNDLDSKANTRAIDSLLNYETVKYFGNEEFEARRYDDNMAKWERAAITNQTTLGVLNFGQGAIIALGMTALLYMASDRVASGEMTLGDLVLINAYLLQLYMPLGFLGFVYREIKHSLIDMEKMFRLLRQDREIQDQDDARELRPNGGTVEFKQVSFAYNEARPILREVSFKVNGGEKVALVGSSGAGKSTIARLLFRFYEASDGDIEIDGQSIKRITQASLRRAIGIVPQDTVLFNDSIYYNILYARPDASEEEVHQAARHAHIHDFILSLPEQYQTQVGERGLKLSGGEKQRVAIARVILKNPRILIFDEATSALDSHSEQAILSALKEIASGHTTLAIAHRLSTITDADRILVMDKGQIVESGSHSQLLQQQGQYAKMWALQQKEEQVNKDA